MNASRALLLVALTLTSVAGCSAAPEGLLPSKPARTTVKMDFFHRPLPEIPLPNDVATRYDESSPTGRRINASTIAPTHFESHTRALLDRLDGWGVFQPIVVPFTGPLDVASLVARHRQANYDPSDDAVYLVDVDRDSPEFGSLHHLDIGNGNYPIVLERRDNYWKNDPRGDTMSLLYEEVEEDLNHNGKLDPGEDLDGNGKLDPGEDTNDNGVLDPPEDTDADGLLDTPNYLPGRHPAEDDLAGRADALMTFYEKATNTLILRPMVPLAERTTYAVVITRRLLDAGGMPVGSPYPYVNHDSQTEALRPLLDVLPAGLSRDDIAFAFTFTTETVEADWKAVRDGLYGHGVQAHLAAEFPAQVDELLPVHDLPVKKDALLFGEEWQTVLPTVATTFQGQKADSESLKALADGAGYIDYFVMGSFQSPQLFERYDAEGKWLPLNDQSWPPDLAEVAAPARAETVYFTLAVPRKEVSVRGEGKPAPVVIAGHGYGSQRFEVFQHAAYLARFGLATIAIDGPSHGIGISAGQMALARGVLGGYGLGALADGIFEDRAYDQNGDGVKDSGADFWSSYLFHTRDMVRQFALDYMQLIRILRSFDGQRRFAFDTGGDGQPDLAGDFDGDGVIDVGQGSPVSMFGGSLGGIMSMVMGSVEPEVKVIAPIAGGGGLSDIGIRSMQGGVPQAFILRGMGPLYVGTVDANTGSMKLEIIVPDLNSDATLELADVDGVAPWDAVVAENLANGERACGFVSPQGTVRVGLASDIGDPTRISIYHGPVLLPEEHCVLRAGAAPFKVVDRFEKQVYFQDKTFDQDSPLVAIAEGLGLRRAHPDFRRFQGIAQTVLDPSDPAVLAPHLQRKPLVYPGTGQATGAHGLIITSSGDMSVCANSGIAFGRAAGLVDYLDVDARYGVPPNQELIDKHVAEAVDKLKRYTDPQGNGVLFDMENFSQGTDMWGTTIPRLAPPLHLGFDETDPLGGKSAAIFPYTVPTGQHGFDLPGVMTDDFRSACEASCTTDPCGCSTKTTFDVGYFMIGMIGRYLESGGKEISVDLCQSSNDCPDQKPAPPARDPSALHAK